MMPTNKRKREGLRRSANVVGQTKLSFKKQNSSVLETKKVSVIRVFISELKQQPPAKYFLLFSATEKTVWFYQVLTVVLRMNY